jgi:hypothetical protein
VSMIYETNDKIEKSTTESDKIANSPLRTVQATRTEPAASPPGGTRQKVPEQGTVVRIGVSEI